MAANIGHLLVRFKGQFYFIPEDKIGPPAPVTRSGAKSIDKLLDQLKKEHPEFFVDALRLSQEELIKLCARN